METLKVGLGDRSYDIAIGADILQDIGPLCFSAGLRGKAAVVTNPVVAPLYLGSVRRSLESAGFLPLVTEIPDGEEHKGAQALNDIYSFLITSGVDRRSFVVALGGGVVGDMAGFAAATYLRGIDFIQVPTTLLAQVDSSVGGKTGINHPLGKNLIGAFHQPRLVLADVGTLRSLSRRDYLAGLAEVVKYGCVLDAAFFSFIEEHVAELEARDAVVLQQIVRRSCELKASVVEKDETEQGLRAVLNYGHTFAHAVESLGEYRTHRHGEAVSIGMVQAALFSRTLGLCDDVEVDRIRGLLAALGLPVELPSHSRQEYLSLLSRDKKVREQGLTFVCNRGLGDFEFVRVSDLSLLVDTCLPES